MNYKYIDHTSDIGIEAKGNSLEQLFENLLTGVIRIYKEKKNFENFSQELFEVGGESLNDLLFNCVDCLIYKIEAEGLFPFNLEITKIIEGRENCKLTGKIDLVGVDQIPGFDNEIKAPTYHQLTVKSVPDGYWGRIIVDV
ncbi:MAG: hypothetical protein APR63_13145 [Desulfuromonas sp. SDB]|nr:MAG: hypothetical protein APR63_13145 [Desulfuromonas sp. SDB]